MNLSLQYQTDYPCFLLIRLLEQSQSWSFDHFQPFCDMRDLLPSLKSDIQPYRLPQEAFPRVHPVLPQLHIIPPRPRRHDQLQLHIRYVSSDACPRPVAKGYECVLLPFRGIIPTLRSELIGVWAPDLGGMVDALGRHAEYGAWRREVTENLDAAGVQRNLAREADAGC